MDCRISIFLLRGQITWSFMAGHNTLWSPLIGPLLGVCMCVCQCVLFRYLSADTALVPNHTKTHTAHEGLRERGGGERWSEWRRKVRGRQFSGGLYPYLAKLSTSSEDTEWIFFPIWAVRGLSLTSPCPCWNLSRLRATWQSNCSKSLQNEPSAHIRWKRTWWSSGC